MKAAGADGGGGGVAANCGARDATAAAKEVGGGGAGTGGGAELLLRPSCFSAMGKPFQHELERGGEGDEMICIRVANRCGLWSRIMGGEERLEW